MGFSTLGRRASILLVVLASCGGSATAGSGVTATQGDPGGPFVASGSSGPFAATAAASSDFTTRFGNGGPFESNGASGPFTKPGSIGGDCAAACQRAATFSCPTDNQDTPSGSAGNGATASSTSLDGCLRDCATLDALQSDCLRNVVGAYVACVLTARLSCDRNGQVQVEGCQEPQVAQCSGTPTTVTDQPGMDNAGGDRGNQGNQNDGGR